MSRRTPDGWSGVGRPAEDTEWDERENPRLLPQVALGAGFTVYAVDDQDS